jgi:hypothetical protein
MPGGALDSILGIVIPAGAFIFFGFIIWRAYGDEIGGMLDWFRGLFVKDNSGPVQSPAANYNRRRDVYGMDSNITYR